MGPVQAEEAAHELDLGGHGADDPRGAGLARLGQHFEAYELGGQEVRLEQAREGGTAQDEVVGAPKSLPSSGCAQQVSAAFLRGG